MEDYFDKIIGKTASLFSTAVEGGGIVSDCAEAETLCLRRYGLNLGIAFQIIDDVDLKKVVQIIYEQNSLISKIIARSIKN